MSIIYSKEKDGTLNVALCGKLTRDPELKEGAKGDRIKFSVTYGKSKFMDCETWGDSTAGGVAGRLEKGDYVVVMGTHRAWEYNDKTYQCVTADGIIPLCNMPVAPTAASPASGTKPDGDGWDTLSEDDDGDLPFEWRVTPPEEQKAIEGF